MSKEETMAFIDKCYERDAADLNLDGRIDAVLQRCKPDLIFADVLTRVLRIVGPELFRAGHTAGAAAGMEAARAINSQGSARNGWAK